MVGLLREDPGSHGLCTANGRVLSKEALGLYSGIQPSVPFSVSQPQAVVDRSPRRALIESFVGSARVEAATVKFDREGTPARGIAACRLADGARTWAYTTDPVEVEDMVECPWEGTIVAVGPDRQLRR